MHHLIPKAQYPFVLCVCHQSKISWMWYEGRPIVIWDQAIKHKYMNDQASFIHFVPISRFINAYLYSSLRFYILLRLRIQAKNNYRLRPYSDNLNSISMNTVSHLILYHSLLILPSKVRKFKNSLRFIFGCILYKRQNRNLYHLIGDPQRQTSQRQILQM